MRTIRVKISASRVEWIFVFITAVLTSSFILWLIDNPIKYTLYIFEVLMVLILYMALRSPYFKHHFNLRVGLYVLSQCGMGRILDLLLILSSFLFIFFSGLAEHQLTGAIGVGGLAKLILSLSLSSFLPGFALLNILDISRRLSRLEQVVFSYALSFSLTSLLSLVCLFSGLEIEFMSVAYVGLALISLKKRFKDKGQTLSPKRRLSFSTNIDIIFLLIIALLVIVGVTYIFPQTSLEPGSDLMRFSAFVGRLLRSPNTYSSYDSVGYHLYLAAVETLSGATYTAIQTALAVFNFMPILAFYIMSKEYLEKVDKRLPAISTLFWIFGGLAWIYVAQLKLTGNMSGLNLLVYASDKTYRGTVYAQGLWTYGNSPFAVSVTIFFLLLYLFRRTDLNKKLYFLLPLLFATAYLTHTTEAVFFSLIIALYSFVSRDKEFAIKESLFSVLLGFGIVSIVYLVLSHVMYFELSLSVLLAFLIPSALIGLAFIFSRRPKLELRLDEKLRRLALPIALSLLLLWAASLLVWGLVQEEFSMYLVDEMGVVPWFFYALILGTAAPLGIVSLYHLLVEPKKYASLKLFVFIAFLMLILGKVVSFINVTYFFSGYWEKRFVMFMYMSFAMLAPLGLTRISDAIYIPRIGDQPKKLRKLSQPICIGFLVSIVVVSGITSSLLCIVTNSYYRSEDLVSNNELEALEFLDKTFDQRPLSRAISITGRSISTLDLAAPPSKPASTMLIYTPYTPESLFHELSLGSSYSYLYMHQRDTSYLNSEFKESYLAQHLLPRLQPVFNNSEVVIYEVPPISSPLPDAHIALTVPFDSSGLSNSYLYAYDALSLGKYNYTTLYDLDDKIMNKESLVLPLDPPRGNVIEKSYNEDFSSPITDEWNFFSGVWKSEGGKLKAGNESSEGIALSPFYAENFTAQFMVKPLAGEPTVYNYAGLIYGWRDSKNYHKALLVFDKTELRVLFQQVADGVVTNYPTWPGLETDLGWQFGEEYNFTVSVKGNLQNLFINGKFYLNCTCEVEPGRIGLYCYRLYETTFDDLSLNTSIKIGLRNPEDYLEYVRKGGSLIVLNTGGYGFFSEDLFTRANTTLLATKIVGEGEITLPEVPTPMIQVGGNIDILSYYISSKGEKTPFSMCSSLGRGKIIYINIYPLITILQRNDATAHEFYPQIKELLKIADAELSEESQTMQIKGTPLEQAAFKDARLKGEIEMSTTSILLPSLNITDLNVTIEGKEHSLPDVSSLAFTNYTSATVNMENVEIDNGKGLYAALTMNGSIRIKLTGSFVNLKVTSERGKIEVLNGTSPEITLFSYESFTFYARSPTIQVKGNALIKSMTIWDQSLNIRLKAGGQNVKIEGFTEFTILYSDVYSKVGNFIAEGMIGRDPPILLWNEWVTVSPFLMSLFILLPYAVLARVLINRRKKPVNKN